mmetsp:Transcript_19189/g.55785  ORF Transcript_19189/g.55785 Transcript_19189/m.55785 type:complete len:369 (-) Transcript_19189:778-1884(-)
MVKGAVDRDIAAVERVPKPQGAGHVASSASSISSASSASVVSTTEAGEAGGTVWAARGALLAMAAICGSNFPLVKILEENYAESSVAAVRFLLAFLPFALWTPCEVPVALAGAEIGLWCSAGYISQAIGLSQTSAGKGAFICALFMVVTPLASMFGLSGSTGGRTVGLRTWGALALCLMGTLVLEVGGGAPGDGLLAAGGGGALVNQGDLWCLGTAIGFGIMFARMEYHMERFSNCVMPLTAWQLLVLAASMLGWDAVTHNGDLLGSMQTFTAAVSPKECLWLLWMGLITTGGVLWGETKVMEFLPATEAGIIFSTEPIWASCFASLLLQESLGDVQKIGAGLIFLGCIATTLAGGHAPPHEPDSAAP